MSRKISIKVKRKWLEMFDDGKTESQIARELGHDLRTVAKGIQEASKDRHLANAEIDMLRTALSRHQDQLTSVLRGISAMLVLPQPNLVLREENGLLTPTPLSGSLLEQMPSGEIALKIHDEEKLEWELLQEHLKADKIWNSIRRWRQVLVNHFRARWLFRKSIKSMLEKETGLKFKHDKKEPREYLLTATTDLFYEVTVSGMLGLTVGTDVENTVVAGNDGFVRFGVGGTVLAKCKDTEVCRNKMISVFTSLAETDDAAEVKATFSELTTITTSTRRMVDEILLLGMITGKCRVCTRLGK